MRKYFNWFLWVLWGALMLALQVAPEEATSNLSKWVIFFGQERFARFIESPTVDDWVFRAGLAIAVIWMGYRIARSWAAKSNHKLRPHSRGADYPQLNEPNYHTWSELDPLKLWQVAYLWEGIKPINPPNIQGKIYRRLEILYRAMVNGQLRFANEWDNLSWALPSVMERTFGSSKIPENIINENTLVTRSALKAYADSIGESPKFLTVTRQHNQSNSAAESVSVKEKASVPDSGVMAEAVKLLVRWEKRWGPYGPAGYQQDNTLEADTTSFLESYCEDYATRKVISAKGDPDTITEILKNIATYLRPEFRQ